MNERIPNRTCLRHKNWSHNPNFLPLQHSSDLNLIFSSIKEYPESPAPTPPKRWTVSPSEKSETRHKVAAISLTLLRCAISPKVERINSSASSTDLGICAAESMEGTLVAFQFWWRGRWRVGIRRTLISFQFMSCHFSSFHFIRPSVLPPLPWWSHTSMNTHKRINVCYRRPPGLLQSIKCTFCKEHEKKNNKINFQPSWCARLVL